MAQGQAKTAASRPEPSQPASQGRPVHETTPLYNLYNARLRRAAPSWGGCGDRLAAGHARRRSRFRHPRRATPGA